jgi:hypothetical protein
VRRASEGGGVGAARQPALVRIRRLDDVAPPADPTLGHEAALGVVRPLDRLPPIFVIVLPALLADALTGAIPRPAPVIVFDGERDRTTSAIVGPARHDGPLAVLEDDVVVRVVFVGTVAPGTARGQHVPAFVERDVVAPWQETLMAVVQLELEFVTVRTIVVAHGVEPMLVVAVRLQIRLVRRGGPRAPLDPIDREPALPVVRELVPRGLRIVARGERAARHRSGEGGDGVVVVTGLRASTHAEYQESHDEAKHVQEHARGPARTQSSGHARVISRLCAE